MENYLSELTESFLRPRARRRDSTARPSCVFMRVRKPCVLARRRLLGWNVRFGILFQLTSIKQPHSNRQTAAQLHQPQRQGQAGEFVPRALYGLGRATVSVAARTKEVREARRGRLLRPCRTAAFPRSTGHSAVLSKYRPSCVKAAETKQAPPGATSPAKRSPKRRFYLVRGHVGLYRFLEQV